MRGISKRGIRGVALRLCCRALSKPQLEGIAHGQRRAPCTLRNLRVSFHPATKLRAELPDKGCVVVPRDRKAVDPSLALNSGCLLSHLIAHFALPGQADSLLLGERHLGGPGFVA